MGVLAFFDRPDLVLPLCPQRPLLNRLISTDVTLLAHAPLIKPSLTSVPFKDEVANRRPDRTNSQSLVSPVGNLNRQMKNV